MSAAMFSMKPKNPDGSSSGNSRCTAIGRSSSPTLAKSLGGGALSTRQRQRT